MKKIEDMNKIEIIELLNELFSKNPEKYPFEWKLQAKLSKNSNIIIEHSNTVANNKVSSYLELKLPIIIATKICW